MAAAQDCRAEALHAGAGARPGAVCVYRESCESVEPTNALHPTIPPPPPPPPHSYLFQK